MTKTMTPTVVAAQGTIDIICENKMMNVCFDLFEKRNGTSHLEMFYYDEDFGCLSSWGSLSVDTGFKLPKDYIYGNTKDPLTKNLLSMFVKAGLLEDTGVFTIHENCFLPMYKLNYELIQKYAIK